MNGVTNWNVGIIVCQDGTTTLWYASHGTRSTVTHGERSMVCRMKKRNDNNIIPVEEFWQRKVDRMRTLYDYRRISQDEYVEGLVRLGFKLKDVIESLEEEE